MFQLRRLANDNLILKVAKGAVNEAVKASLDAIFKAVTICQERRLDTG